MLSLVSFFMRRLPHQRRVLRLEVLMAQLLQCCCSSSIVSAPHLSERAYCTYIFMGFCYTAHFIQHSGISSIGRYLIYSINQKFALMLSVLRQFIEPPLERMATQLPFSPSFFFLSFCCQLYFRCKLQVWGQISRKCVGLRSSWSVLCGGSYVSIWGCCCGWIIEKWVLVGEDEDL